MVQFETIRRLLSNPKDLVMVAGWAFHRKVRRQSGRHIMDADWDNLVILDACRYDLFAAVNDIEGDLSAVVSRGSSTAEFLVRTFKTDDRTYSDTVYVSGNPQIRNWGVEDAFHESVPVWETDWDDEVETVKPGDLADRAIAANQQYPNKRLLVHFLQPHYPFIGELGQSIEHRTIHGGGEIAAPDDVSASIWGRLSDGEASADQVWAAYRENLELTLPHVERLVDELVGKTVVTSDHGNAFGRYGIYGHPSKRYLKELVEVPWLEIEGDERKMLLDGELRDRPNTDLAVQGRLKQLGYT